MLIRKFLQYLNPAKLFKSESENINLNMMHGINKLSIVMFLFCLGVLVYKWLT